ncbi:MAG: restriction endonuclease subunit S [Candidatus Nanogingivalaceae bacterium]|jgi:restriction modification system DNA specificity domain protein|nr:restriction endonuclease subunit S [Candidatus Nanogingivalaceae bacterium]
MQKVLSDICYYVSDKIPVKQVQLADYVSTENLLQNKGGLSVANKLPSGKVTAFQAGDVLVSNIRPYFKKIWLADRSGGASNDVLVFRKLNDEIYEKYLYYILADDRFFAFSTASASGSKMPRGDKVQIMNYPVKLPPLESQKKIADILSSLDEKIELNRRMNETLEQLGQALFRYYFVDNPEAKNWESGRVSDVVRIYSGFAFKSKDFDINGKYGLVTIKNVQDGSFIKDCTDHLSEPLPDKTPEYVHLKSGDIILSLTGNVGRVCIVVGRDYLLNQRVAKLVSDESQAYTYFLFRSKIMKGRMVGISKGTAQKNLSPIETGKLKIKIPPTNIMSQFEEIAIDLLNMIVSNNEQIQTLTSLRDSLLPKLISGDIKV